MQSPFTKKYFSRNRANLRASVAPELPIIITANMEVQYSADTAYPFRQDTNFWYLTGLDNPDMIYLHDGEKETLILPKPNQVRDVFDGEANIESIQKISGISRVVSYKQGMNLVKNLVQKHQHIATQLPATGLRSIFGIAPNPARKELIKKLRRYKKGLTFKHLGAQFAHLRMIKSSEELVAIKQAIDITIKGFEVIRPLIISGANEYVLDAELTAHFRKNNARHAYPPIIASGKNACVIHYDSNQKVLKKDELVLFDIGAEKNKFSADISRTFTTTKPTKRQLQIFSAVIELQDEAMSLLKPGVLIRDYERTMEEKMGQALKKLGIIKVASRKQIRKYYPHATSHHLGLDIHDAADYDKPLQPGMVITVEPGIYAPNESTGIRIEDDVLITDSGIEILTAALPRDLS